MMNQNTIFILMNNNYKSTLVDYLIHHIGYLLLFITNNSIYNRHNNHTQTCSNYLHFHYASLSKARGGDVMRVFTAHILICIHVIILFICVDLFEVYY